MRTPQSRGDCDSIDEELKDIKGDSEELMSIACSQARSLIVGVGIDGTKLTSSKRDIEYWCDCEDPPQVFCRGGSSMLKIQPKSQKVLDSSAYLS